MDAYEKEALGSKLMKDALDFNPISDDDPLHNFLEGIIEGVDYIYTPEYKQKVLADHKITPEECLKIPMDVLAFGIKAVPEKTPWLKSVLGISKELGMIIGEAIRDDGVKEQKASIEENAFVGGGGGGR